MAVGTWTIMRRAEPKIGNGTIDLDSHTFKAVLTTSAQALTDDFAGASTDCRYADLTAEVAAGGGYSTGGLTLTGVTWTRAGATVTFDCDAMDWGTPTTITAKYLSIVDDTAANKDIVAFVDLDAGGGSVSSTASQFKITIHASGVFAMTKSP